MTNNRPNTQEKQETVIMSVRHNAEALIVKPIDKNAPVETMEWLLIMRRELKAEWAKSEFDKAMAAFQSECPIIKKQRASKPIPGN